jgi:hypothetical protein
MQTEEGFFQGHCVMLEDSYISPSSADEVTSTACKTEPHANLNAAFLNLVG